MSRRTARSPTSRPVDEIGPKEAVHDLALGAGRQRPPDQPVRVERVGRTRGGRRRRRGRPQRRARRDCRGSPSAGRRVRTSAPCTPRGRGPPLGIVAGRAGRDASARRPARSVRPAPPRGASRRIAPRADDVADDVDGERVRRLGHRNISICRRAGRRGLPSRWRNRGASAQGRGPLDPPLRVGQVRRHFEIVRLPDDRPRAVAGRRRGAGRPSDDDRAPSPPPREGAATMVAVYVALLFAPVAFAESTRLLIAWNVGLLGAFSR